MRCWIQTVERSANPRYYALIEEFGRITGVPVLLNTSFNRKEPIVALRNSLIIRNSSHGLFFNIGYSENGTKFCYLYNCTVADNGGHGFYSQQANWDPDLIPIAKNTIFTGNNGYGIWKAGNRAGSSMTTTGTIPRLPICSRTWLIVRLRGAAPGASRGPRGR
jgi:hypothetical protein